MSYADILYNSARQRAARRHAAEQCELARLELMRMRAAQDTINKLFNPCAEQPTIELAAINLQDMPVRDTEGLPLVREVVIR